MPPLEYSDCFLDTPGFREIISQYEQELENNAIVVKNLVRECKNMIKMTEGTCVSLHGPPPVWERVSCLHSRSIVRTGLESYKVIRYSLCLNPVQSVGVFLLSGCSRQSACMFVKRNDRFLYVVALKVRGIVGLVLSYPCEYTYAKVLSILLRSLHHFFFQLHCTCMCHVA